MKAVLLCSHPGGGQSSRHDLTGRLPVEVIAGDAGGQGGGHLWCLRQPGVEWIHGNVQRIMLLCLCSKRPRGGEGARSSVKTLTEVKYFDGYTSRRVALTKQAHRWEFDDQQPKHQPTLIETRIGLTLST